MRAGQWCWLGAVAGLFWPSVAAAEPFGGIDFKITETSIVNYHTDNRDNFRTNDNYGEWLNRLNLQGTRGPFTLQVRLDSALYFKKPDPNTLARDDASDPANARLIEQRAQLQGVSVDEARARFTEQQTLAFGRDLSTRFVNMVYPSKVSFSYIEGSVDLTVGDFYTQLGRGQVLAMRKADELAVDTTLRGAKLEYKPELDRMRFRLTLLAGLSNPLRVDEVSGRQLTQLNAGLGGALFPLAPQPNPTFYVANPQPSFAPDRLVGARVEHGVKEVQFGFQAAHLRREADFYKTIDTNSPARSARDATNVGLSVNLPNLADHGNVYVEASLQSLQNAFSAADASAESRADNEAYVRRLSGGKALYALLSLFHGPVTITLEGKHYDRFFPLAASVAGAPEFVALQYNNPPTTEPIWSDTQFGLFNACVTGGRARADVRVNEHAILFSHVGAYVTHSERDATCGQIVSTDDEGNAQKPTGKVRENRNDIVDPWIGAEFYAEGNRTHAFLSLGTRFDRTADPLEYSEVDGATRDYYREYYHIRYDFIKKISGPWSIQTAGFHRYRYKPEQKPTPWYEGENYLSLLYSPKITAAIGYEYTTLFGDHKNFYSVQSVYRITTDTTVRLFVGQSRPALRCVSGVCRQFPAFEGAKLEAVVRF